MALNQTEVAPKLIPWLRMAPPTKNTLVECIVDLIKANVLNWRYTYIYIHNIYIYIHKIYIYIYMCVHI